MMCSLFFFATLLNQASDDPVFSGPQPGEKLTPFTTSSVLGKQADQKIDLTAESATLPCVIVFVHERTRPAFGLARAVMNLVADRGSKKVTGGLVFLSEDPTETANWIGRISKYFPKGVTVGVSPDGKEGPGAYGLNRNVAMTVLITRNQVVSANFALIQPSVEVDGPKIFKAIAEVLGEKDVPKVSDFGGPRYGGRTKKMSRTEADSKPDSKLRQLLAPMIQKDATNDQVAAAAEKVKKYAEQNTQAKVQIGQIARRIVDAGKLENYGTAKAQEYLKKWAVEFTPKSRAPSDRNRD